jgi:hypothetical protein
LLECLLPAIGELFDLPSTITACSDPETVNFEGIQLSTQGAERQKKDATYLELCFAKMEPNGDSEHLGTSQFQGTQDGNSF